MMHINLNEFAVRRRKPKNAVEGNKLEENLAQKGDTWKAKFEGKRHSKNMMNGKENIATRG
jgi:hypothetical protein